LRNTWLFVRLLHKVEQDRLEHLRILIHQTSIHPFVNVGRSPYRWASTLVVHFHQCLLI
jgi:hypothetical protein